MEVVCILAPIFLFVLLKMGLEHRAEGRNQTVRLLEQALKNPAVDRATIESLTHQLTGRRPPRHGGVGSLMTFVLSIGWIALFVGIGLLIVDSVLGGDDVMIGGVVTALAGFGLVTWPFAIRELEARRQVQ